MSDTRLQQFKSRRDPPPLISATCERIACVYNSIKCTPPPAPSFCVNGNASCSIKVGRNKIALPRRKRSPLSSESNRPSALCSTPGICICVVVEYGNIFSAFAGERVLFSTAGCRGAHGCKVDLGKNSIYLSLSPIKLANVHAGFN